MSSPAHTPAMLLSPNQSPTPSAVGRSVSEGLHRRLASEPHQSLKKTSQKEQLSISRQESIEEAVEQVPFNLARVVVNMQEYYASELEAERQRTEDLATQNEEMMTRMGIMEKRLQMHVILMDGFVNFMREAKEGNFAGAGSAELEIAQAFGGEHLEEVRGLVSNCAPVHQSVEQVDLSLQMPSEPEDDSHEVTQPTQDDSPLEVNAFDQLPPTPDVESAPVRSTGRRAPKRKNPPTMLYRAVKRRTRANVLSVKLREAASWTPINAQSCTQLSADSGDEHVGENGDLDYTPDLEEDEEQEPDGTPASEQASPSPSPSVSDDDFDLDSAKPRYSVPRSVGYRHAAGPSGRRFKYHRMPKTVALVWQEWKHGSHGNPAIEALEKKYNTAWRMGTLQERKYASNYVGVRQKIVRKVEEMCEEEGLTVEQACEKLDERVDGRMQLLMTALRKGEDPLVVIQRKRR
ncbi:Ff.00g043810.m01.CDS01 [Fusarium sp. VM40]|nr:Ff.00g043810.m01.CDS01 [Fusarium sp. VM40]